MAIHMHAHKAFRICLLQPHTVGRKGTMDTESFVPCGPELPFTTSELDICVKVIHSLSQNQGLFRAPWLRSLRMAILPLVDTMATRKEEGIYRTRKRDLEDLESIRRGILKQAKARDRQATNDCMLRADRVAKMRKLLDKEALPLIPDGPVRDDDRKLLLLPPPKTSSSTSSPRLFSPRPCYTCDQHFIQLHHFYDQLCPSCAAFNYTKRHQTANLEGKIALVTGARIKIGFFTTLKLLRAGATVIATTRFPCDALERYQRESTYHEFQDRLHIFGVDLRDLVHLHCFLDYISSTFERLDIIIHNAAQTVRRPPQFYKHLMTKELALAEQLTTQQLPQLTRYAKFQSQLNKAESPQLTYQNPDPVALSCVSPRPSAVHPAMSSAIKSQIPVLCSDYDVQLQSFPIGKYDVHGQQVDLRTKNSWGLRLGEIETPEVAEVFTINAMAPFVINNRLVPMLGRPNTAHVPKFIINVSAMEGQFHRFKQPTHPHTNMAKAALNMMTRTCAADLSRRQIYMNSVDTGWINDERPLPTAFHSANTNNFQTPLDEIDAASRVLDPLFTAVMKPQSKPQWGCFLKDYRPTDW